MTTQATTQSPSCQVIPLLAELHYPANDQVIVARTYDSVAQTGIIKVRSEDPTGTVARVIVIVLNPGDPETMPASIAGGVPPGHTELAQEPGTSFFSNSSVPVTTLPPTSPSGDNKKVLIGSYDNTNSYLGQVKSTFAVVPPTFNVSVSATCCIWLIFAPSGTTLVPYGETVPLYLPVALLVPSDNGVAPIASAALVALSTASWRHDPADSQASDANGLVGTAQPLDPGKATIYQNATLGSNVITSATVPLNQLVALWNYGAGNPAAEVGWANATLNVVAQGGASPTTLHLAFHDGYQWSNNSGTVQVTVTWQT